MGSVRELTNSAGTVQETYTYNSYGQLAAAPTIVNPFTYTGREYDSESGNYYYRNRNMNPSQGRFMQRDPIGYYDSMNLQQYVGNNPINYVDPSGEKKKKVPGADFWKDDCDAVSMAECILQCGERGVESCKDVYKLQKTIRNGQPAITFKKQNKSCSCNEDDNDGGKGDDGGGGSGAMCPINPNLPPLRFPPTKIPPFAE